MNLKIKKYLIGAGMAAVVLSGVFSLVLAENMDQKTSKADSHLQPMVVQIGPNGKTLLRGTVKTVGTSSLTVTSWGGDWMVNVSSLTKLMPGSDMSQFKVGDFVGLHGSISQSAVWTVDATLVRDWTEKIEVRTNKQEIREIIKAESPKNWQGAMSNINVSGRSFTLTIDDIAYTVNVAVDAKIVNQKYLTISFSDIKDGDVVRVWGPSSDTTITAFVVRDVSIGTQTSNSRICEYAVPPPGCHYVNGPNYNPITTCGMILSCSTTNSGY